MENDMYSDLPPMYWRVSNMVLEGRETMERRVKEWWPTCKRFMEMLLEPR